MADFCQQCSVAHFGKDYRELAGITKPEDWAQQKAVVTICEGCGVIQVDPEGRCVSPDCMENGHPKFRAPTDLVSQQYQGPPNLDVPTWIDDHNTPAGKKTP